MDTFAVFLGPPIEICEDEYVPHLHDYKGSGPRYEAVDCNEPSTLVIGGSIAAIVLVVAVVAVLIRKSGRGGKD